MSLEWCTVYLVSVNMQTLLSYLVLYRNFCICVLLLQCLLCIADIIGIVGIMLSGQTTATHGLLTFGLNLAVEQEYNAARQQGGLLHRQVPQNAALGVVPAAEKAEAKIQSTGCCC